MAALPVAHPVQSSPRTTSLAKRSETKNQRAGGDEDVGDDRRIACMLRVNRKSADARCSRFANPSTASCLTRNSTCRSGLVN